MEENNNNDNNNNNNGVCSSNSNNNEQQGQTFISDNSFIDMKFLRIFIVIDGNNNLTDNVAKYAKLGKKTKSLKLLIKLYLNNYC